MLRSRVSRRHCSRFQKSNKRQRSHFEPLEVRALLSAALPSAPGKLVAALAAPVDVHLAWQTSGSGVTYTVLREAAGEAMFSIVGTSAITTFEDTTVTPGLSYEYEVTATDTVGTSGTSSIVSATPIAPLPAPWLDEDIGAVGLAGTAGQNADGSLAVTGGGADIWNTADAFHFAYQPIPDDAKVVVQVSAEQNTDPWAKAGLMIRSSLAANSAEVSLLVTPGNVAMVETRTATGKTTGSSNTNLPGGGEWLQLVRSGGTITASLSRDGVNWSLFKSAALPAGPAYLGLAVTAHNNAKLNTSSFANLAMTIAPPPPLPTAPTAPVVVAVSSADALLSWTQPPSVGAITSYTVFRQGPTDIAPVGVGTTTMTSFDDTGVTPGVIETYTVVANNATGSSPMSGSLPVAVPAASPSPWSDTDIGSVGLVGGAMVAAGNASITVQGGGADVWGTNDAFNYDYQPLVGNGSIVTQIDSVQNTSSWAKAGVMIRESLRNDARNVLIALTPGNGITFQSRVATQNVTTNAVTKGTAGEWLELTRVGSTLTALISSDGLTWTTFGTATIPMVNNVYAGVFVTAHNNAKLCTATFGHVAVATTGVAASNWTSASNAPMNRWEAQSFTWDNQFYVFGGYIDTSLDSTAECDVYNPASDTWNQLTSFPVGGLAHAGTTLVGDTVYFAGGDVGTFTQGKTLTATAAVLSYNLDTNQWGALPSLPAAVSSGGFVAINQTLYCYGGINATDKIDLSATYAFDLNNPQLGWQTEAPMPDARNHFGSVAINGIAYAIGGQHLYNQTQGSDVQVDAYNPVTNTWSTVAALPQPWSSVHVSTLAINGKIVIVGGKTNGGYDGIYQNGIEEYDPVANTWSSVGVLPEANEGLSVGYINGALIAVGGTVDNNGGRAIDQTWIDSMLQF